MMVDEDDDVEEGNLIMEATTLPELVGELLDLARSSSSGRAAHTVYGGQAHGLRQTVIALAGGHDLAEHESPGDATLQVLSGRVRLTAGDDSWEGSAGGLVAIPPARHALAALEDAAVLLTVRVDR